MVPSGECLRWSLNNLLRLDGAEHSEPQGCPRRLDAKIDFFISFMGSWKNFLSPLISQVTLLSPRTALVELVYRRANSAW